MRVHSELRISFFSCREGEGITTLIAFWCWVSGIGVGPVDIECFEGSCLGAGEGSLEALLLLLLLLLLVLLLVLLWSWLARPLTAGEKRRDDEMDEVSSEPLSFLFNGFE